MTVTEHCFAEATLEVEIMVKGRKKGGESLKKTDKLQFISDEREKMRGHEGNRSRDAVRNNAFSEGRFRRSLILVIKYPFLC